jgi:prepilin peptidase dependent protein B
MLSRMPRGVAARGLSLIELMVGMVVGLFIVGGAAYFAVNFTGENRRLLLEARLMQDMRATMDIVTRDLRRAGYWQNAASAAGLGGVQGTTSIAAAGFAVVTPASGATASAVSYYYDKTGGATAAVSDAFGFDLSGGILRTTIGAAASQPLTDDKTMFVERFDVGLEVDTEDMSAGCSKTCTVNCPVIYVRTFNVEMEARAVADSAVKRTLRSKVKVRNDYQTGSCPA